MMGLSLIWNVASDVGSYWRSKATSWLLTKSPRDIAFQNLTNATTFEEWEQSALQLDDLLQTDLWRQNAASKSYDYRLINERRRAIIEAREDGDVLGLVNLLRSGLVRNLGNITTPKLFNRAYTGTKLLIEEYVTQVALAVEFVTGFPTTGGDEPAWTSQAKLDLLHDTRQAFGRSTLVLQGGAIFGLCHLGVVKALHLRGLLPRIITGTATGALIAALVGIHTEDELLEFLNGDGIDLTAFTRRNRSGKKHDDEKSLLSDAGYGYMQTLVRRVTRFIREGYFLDVNVLEECVRANVGDMTFEEAYARTKRVLNITVATSGRGGIPNLLNYLTAPNVLIWSAALASNTSSTTLYSPVPLLCKDETGAIVPYTTPSSISEIRSFRKITYTSHRDSPLSRIAELFNVNHFIVSQARPYIAPFLRSSLQNSSPSSQPGRSTLSGTLMRLTILELRHRLHQASSLGLLPSPVSRLLLDEEIPGGDASLTLVPSLQVPDLVRLLETPSREGLGYWVLRGERSVWPAVGALRVRCAVEVELDRGYQRIRRGGGWQGRSDGDGEEEEEVEGEMEKGREREMVLKRTESSKRSRRRALSAEQV